LLTGNAANTDPVCDLSPFHQVVLQAVAEAQEPQVTRPLPMFRNVKNSKVLSV
jgi:pyrroloquinoline quinone biosynthesis protein E